MGCALSYIADMIGYDSGLGRGDHKLQFVVFIFFSHCLGWAHFVDPLFMTKKIEIVFFSRRP